MNKCCYCQVPQTDENSYRRSGKRNNLFTSACKQCIKEKSNLRKVGYIKKNVNHSCEKCINKILKCYKCKEIKPLIDFHLSSNTTSGHSYECKPCDIADAKIIRKKNSNHSCQENQCDLITKYCPHCKYNFNLLHFDKSTSYHNIHARCVVKEYINSSNQRNMKFDLSNDEVNYIVNKPCIYCNFQDIYKRNGIDRLSSDLGYETDNVVPCCLICNVSKNNMSLDAFMNWLQRFGIDTESITTRIENFKLCLKEVQYELV